MTLAESLYFYRLQFFSRVKQEQLYLLDRVLLRVKEQTESKDTQQWVFSKYLYPPLPFPLLGKWVLRIAEEKDRWGGTMNSPLQ